MIKKNYIVHIDVSQARGWQAFECVAESKEEALKIFEMGDGYFVDEEIEVYSIEDPRIKDIEEVSIDDRK